MKDTLRYLCWLLVFSSFVSAVADQNYSQQVFFENSLSPGSYFYSAGKVSAPSTLELVGGKLPVESREFISGPNALELNGDLCPREDGMQRSSSIDGVTVMWILRVTAFIYGFTPKKGSTRQTCRRSPWWI